MTDPRTRFPGIAAAEEALYQLSLKANALTDPLRRFLDACDVLRYDVLEQIAPGTCPYPTPRTEPCPR